MKKIKYYSYYLVNNLFSLTLAGFCLLALVLSSACKKTKNASLQTEQRYNGLSSADFSAPVRCAAPDYFHKGGISVWNDLAFVRHAQPEFYYIEQIRAIAQGTGACNNGWKQGEWVYHYQSGGVHRIAKGSYNNGKKEGEWIYYKHSEADENPRKEVYQAGQLQKQIWGGVTTAYTYNTAGQLIEEVLYHDDHTHKTTIQYNAQGQPVAIKNDGVSAFTFTYEDKGRLRTIAQNQNNIQYVYNDQGKIQETKATLEEGKVQVIYSYIYDAQGFLVKETMTRSGDSPVYLETLYTPYPNGRLEKEEHILYDNSNNKTPVKKTLITYAMNGTEQSYNKLQYQDGQWTRAVSETTHTQHSH